MPMTDSVIIRTSCTEILLLVVVRSYFEVKYVLIRQCTGEGQIYRTSDQTKPSSMVRIL